MTAAGPTLDRADVLVTGGRISAVGPDLAPPPGAEILDLGGRWITPGLIDPHAPLDAGGETPDGAAPLTPELRAVDGLWPPQRALRAASAGGVTLIHVPAAGWGPVGGVGVSLHVEPGRPTPDLRVDGPASMGISCAAHGAGPRARMVREAGLRQALENARSAAPRGAPVDLGQQALRGVLRGDTLVQSPCSRAGAMLRRLELFRAWGVRLRAFHHAVEAYQIRDTLARQDVAAVVWADGWADPSQRWDAVPASAALLDAAGVRVALHSDSLDDVERLNQHAARALANGLRAGLLVDRDRAIRWITANPAWVLGLDDRYGTIEPGKLADLTVWSADPFSVYARADLVLIEGRRVFDRAAASRAPPAPGASAGAPGSAETP